MAMGMVAWSFTFASWLPWTLLALATTSLYFASRLEMYLVLVFVFLRNWASVTQFLPSFSTSVLLILAGAIAFIFVQISSLSGSNSTTHDVEDQEPKPLFFPCTTAHTRLFPKIHSFSYSYMWSGIPIGWTGSIGGMLAGDQVTIGFRPSLKNGTGSAWFTIDADEYLERETAPNGLRGKLDQFLEHQGADPEDYPYAYLMTVAKFMKYSFNPVSFWYLYSAEKDLSAMILEVNNTFGERNMYFLKASQDDDPSEEPFSSEPEPPLERGASKGKPTRFSTTWPKTFFVSPYNSRKGAYSLITYDPLYPSMTGHGPVNNILTLKSSKGHPKLIARIFSSSAAIDPATMSLLHKLQFLVSWSWVAFATLPRTVYEAASLYYKNLHIWSRPEPVVVNISRPASSTEKVLEAYFRKYLSHLVSTASSPLVVKYTAAGIHGTSTETFVSPLAANASSSTFSTHPTNLNVREDKRDAVQSLEFRVLTPLFYTRFPHYAHDLEAIFSEMHLTAPTLSINPASLLPSLVLRKPSAPQTTPNYLTYLSFATIKNLRQRPTDIQPSDPSPRAQKAKSEKAAREASVGVSAAGTEIRDVRNFRLSPMDGFVLAECSDAEKRSYAWAVLKVFLADWIAWGDMDVFSLEVFILQAGVAWVLAGAVRGLWSGGGV